MPAPPTFVLGLGAQKAGTTWLSAYLRDSPDYAYGFRKEYHVLDLIDLEQERWLLRRDTRLAGRALDAVLERELTPKNAAFLHRMAMVADERIYFDYLAQLLHTTPGARATADLSPSYAQLSARRMRAVQDEFSSRGVRTVAAFLMRDPVERVWSHLRMLAHRHPEEYGDLEDELRTGFAHEQFASRTRYHRTLAAIGEAFAPQESFVGLYETMTTDGLELRRFCDLVGIGFHEPRYERRSNAAPSGRALPESLTRTVAEHYAEVYREVDRIRPDLEIARWWPHAHWVL